MNYCIFCQKEIKKSNTYFCSKKCENNYHLVEDKTVYYTKNIVCPYCGYENTDSWEMHDDEDEEYSCPRCGEDFEVVREYTVTYTSTPKLDVLIKLKL